MINQGTNYQISPSASLLTKYSSAEIYKIFQNSASSYALTFLAFNGSNGKFAIASKDIPKVTQILVATGIQSNFLGTFEFEDYKNPTTTNTTNTTQQTNVSVKYDPNNYVSYPVRSGEYAYLISKKFTGSTNRWTEIIRASNSTFLNSTQATQLKVGEILLLPKAWSSSVTTDSNVITPLPNSDPAKKKDDGVLFLMALGYAGFKLFM